MNKKLLLWMVTLVLLVSFASAYSDSDLEGAWKFDTSGATSPDYLGVNDMTNSIDAHSSSGGIDGGYYTFSGSADYGELYDFQISDGTSFSFWYYSSGWDAGGERFFWKGSTGGAATDDYGFARYSTTNQVDFFIGAGGSSYHRWRTDSGVLDADSSWHHFVIVINTANDVEIWHDGVEASVTDYGNTASLSYYNTANNLLIGKDDYYDSTNDYQSSLDEFYIFDKALTQTEIEDLYNSGTGDFVPFTAPATEYFEFRLTSGSNLSVRFSNGTTYTNTTGSIITTGILSNDTTNLESFTLYKTNYFNISVTDYNTTQDYNFTYDKYFFVNATDAESGAKITDFTCVYVESIAPLTEHTFSSDANGNAYFVEINNTAFNGCKNFVAENYTAYDVPFTDTVLSDTYRTLQVYHFPYVNASDSWDNSSITNITITIEGSNYSSGSDGKIWLNTTGSKAYTLYADNYLPLSGTHDFTNSTDLEVSMYQAVVYFNASQILTGSTLSGVTFTVDGNTDNPKYLAAGVYNVTGSKSGYYSGIVEFNVTALDNKTVTVTDMSDTVINLTALHAYNNATISNFSGYLYHNDTGTNITFSTTTGYYEIPSAQNETFHLVVRSTGNYATSVYSITPNATVYNYTVYMYQYNSLLITFEDIITGATVNNVTLDLVSDIYSSSYNTTNGTIYATILQPTSYQARYDSEGYVETFYYFTVNDDTYQNLTLYLLNESLYSNVTIEIYNQYAQEVEGAVVKALRFDIDSNSYELQEIGVTNVNGETIMHLTKFDEYYKFQVELAGETLKNTNPAYITGDVVTIQITVGDPVGTTWSQYQDIDFDLFYNESTSNFRLDYNDASNIGGTYCLYAYRSSYSGDILESSTCSSSSSGTLLAPITALNSTLYIAKAYYDSELLDTETYETGAYNLGSMGLFFQAILTLLFAVIAFHDTGLVPVAVGFSIVLGRLLGLTALSTGVTLTLFVALLILTFIIKRNQIR